MTPTTEGVPPTPEELDAMLRLLDDETPQVRQTIAQRLALSGGDISEWLICNPRQLEADECKTLSDLLAPGRRTTLEREWQAPSGGASALRDDWDRFEALLRLISDFLHDGITVRQPLSDALDLLAEEAAADGVNSARDLSKFLFSKGKLEGNRDDIENPCNSDLAWAIAEGRSNPLGLCLIFILTARRLHHEVEPVNFPGHFLSRIFEDGYPIIIDCFDSGRLHLQSTLLESPDLGETERSILADTTDPGTMLVRMFNNLETALEIAQRDEDTQLIRKLRDTLT